MSRPSCNTQPGVVRATEIVTDIGRSDSLTDLAARINAAHEAVQAALKSSIINAMHAGELLIAAKAKLKHGEWLPWLKANFPFTDRTARNYMMLARRRPEVEAKLETDSDLTLRDLFAETESEEEPDAEAKAETEAKLSAAGNYRAMGTGSVEYFAPPEILVRVRATFGGTIDLDPASCEKAQEIVKAARFYTVNDDGLAQPWFGTVFCNPPAAWPHVANFAGKFITEYTVGHTKAEIMLTHNSSDTGWYRQLLDNCHALCIVRGRIRFLGPDGRECGSPPQGQNIFYIGSDPATFAQHFADVGRILPLRAVWGRAERAAFGDAWTARTDADMGNSAA
jgi:hypothetical protein